MANWKKSAYSRINRKVDLALANQKLLLAKQKQIKKEEDNIQKLEKEEIDAEKRCSLNQQQELGEIAKIEAMKGELKSQLENGSPLRNITYRDVTKGLIGAFFGVVSYFSFVKGAEIGQSFSTGRAAFVYLVAFTMLVAFLYFSGFRKVDDKVKYKYLPVRAVVIYFTSILATYLVLLLFDVIHFGTPLVELFKTMSSISVLAVLGAATADLIGKNDE